MSKFCQVLLLCFSTLLFAACGGGGGGGGDDAPVQQPQPPQPGPNPPSGPTPPAGPPTAQADALQTVQGTALQGQLQAMDPAGSRLTFSIVSNPAKGQLEMLDANLGHFRYTPQAGVHGSDEFSFQADNGSEISNTAVVSITIVASNLPPEPVASCWTTAQDSAVSNQLDATDPESAPEQLRYSVVQDGRKGTVEIAADGAFTYTPDSSGPRGADSFSFQVLDPDGGSATGEVTVIIDQHIMPLGDSITVGEGSDDDPPVSERVGYRRELYQELTRERGFGIDFVGGQKDGGGATPALADLDHEGHSGWNATELLNGNHLGGGVWAWLNANPADIVLLHIGTNDFATTSVADIEAILDEIDRWEAANNPVTVLLAQIIEFAPFSGEVTAFNQGLATLVASRAAAGDALLLVDQHSALEYPADMADDYHPAPSGYSKMAATWLDSLLDQEGASGRWGETGPLQTCP